MNNLNYGVIGNCRTAALISEKGNIEWLCFPDFDSPSIFAALLDRDKGGCFGFEVSNEYRISQSYVPHTNILSTHFSSDEGELVVLDFMPCYRSYEKEHYLPAEIYRYIRWIKGTPRFKVNYNPAPDYARGKVIHNITDEYIETYCSSENKDRQYLYSSLSLQDIEQKKEITLQQDEFFLLSYNEKVIPIDIEREKLEYCRTLVYWLNWTNRTKKYSLYNDVIERSLLVLKLMSYYNGAVLAALTTSLPETVGDVRNWDYRFCWLRDASMSIETLFQIGHAGAARRFMKFIQSTFVAKHESFQIMYGIRGERQLKEIILDHLDGYKNSKPVRIGNDAYHQRQNDSFGYLMDLIYQYYRLMPGTLDEIEDMWGNGEEYSRHSRRRMERTRQRNLGNQGGKPAFRLFESNVLGRFGSGNENRQYAKKIQIYRTLAERSRQDKNRCDDSRLERKNPQFFPDLRKHSLRFLPAPHGALRLHRSERYSLSPNSESHKKSVVTQRLDVPIQQQRRLRTALLGIHDMHLLAREGSFRHRRKRRGPLPVRRNTEMLQSLGSVQRRFGLRHQRTIREFPPSLFPSGSGKHGHSICRRRQEIIVHSTLKKQKRDGITKTFLHNIVISTVPVFDF